MAAGTTVSLGTAVPLQGAEGAPTRRPPRNRDELDAPGVRAMAFLPDGRSLLLGTLTGVVPLDAFSGVVLQTLSGTTEGTAERCTTDAWRVLLSSASGDVRVSAGGVLSVWVRRGVLVLPPRRRGVPPPLLHLLPLPGGHGRWSFVVGVGVKVDVGGWGWLPLAVLPVLQQHCRLPCLWIPPHLVTATPGRSVPLPPAERAAVLAAAAANGGADRRPRSVGGPP